MPITVSWATPIASGSSRASMAGASGTRRNGCRPVRQSGLLSDAGGRRAGRLRAAEKQQTSCSGSGGMPVTRRGLRGTCPGRAAVACP